MPVKKKTTKAKTDRLANNLKPASPFKGIMLVVIVAAAVGIGYAAIKTFAAGHILTNGAAKINLLFGSGVKQTDSHGGLPTTTVWRLERNEATLATKYLLTGLSPNINAKFCVRYRFSVPSSNNRFRMMGRDFIANGSYTYQKSCLGPVAYNLKVGAVNTVAQSFSNYGPGDMYVQNMSLEW